MALLLRLFLFAKGATLTAVLVHAFVRNFVSFFSHYLTNKGLISTPIQFVFCEGSLPEETNNEKTKYIPVGSCPVTTYLISPPNSLDKENVVFSVASKVVVPSLSSPLTIGNNPFFKFVYEPFCTQLNIP